MFEKGLKTIEVNHSTAKSLGTLNHVRQHHIYMTFKYIQEWWLHHVLG